MPETMPDTEPTVAVLVAPLLQVPPPGLQLSDVEAPAQILYVPVIAPGGGLTVTVVLVVQPLAEV
jgi:hypothetical protein